MTWGLAMGDGVHISTSDNKCRRTAMITAYSMCPFLAKMNNYADDHPSLPMVGQDPGESLTLSETILAAFVAISNSVKYIRALDDKC